MSTRDRTVPEKVRDWLVAYNAVRAELTDDKVRTLIAQVTADDPASVHLAIDMARIAYANDRQAGVIAAMLTQSGVSRPTMTEETV